MTSSFSDVFYIDASTVATIDAGLKNIAVIKHFGNSQEDGLLWLQSKVDGWLLLLDNADNPEIDLHQAIPKCNHGNIIITSRNPGHRVYGSYSLVSDLEQKDAVTLLLKSAAQVATIETEQVGVDTVKVW